MTNIVLVLSTAKQHLSLIADELSRLPEVPVLVEVADSYALDPFALARRFAQLNLEEPVVVGYVLPMETDDVDEHRMLWWKHLLREERFRDDDSVKELELAPWCDGSGRLWLDGVDQLMDGGPEWNELLDDEPLAEWERELLN